MQPLPVHHSDDNFGIPHLFLTYQHNTIVEENRASCEYDKNLYCLHCRFKKREHVLLPPNRDSLVKGMPFCTSFIPVYTQNGGEKQKSPFQ